MKFQDPCCACLERSCKAARESAGQIFATGGGVLVLVLVLLGEKSTARQQNVSRSPMPLSNFRDRRRRPGPGACGGEVSSAPAKFVRSPQIAMRPFSTANAAHTRRKFSTMVKIFAKSEQDQNSKLVALVFSLMQTDEFPVNFCLLYFFGFSSALHLFV